MIKVKMFYTENDEVCTSEQMFADFAKAVRFFADVQKYVHTVTHAKLIAHRRVIDEF